MPPRAVVVVVARSALALALVFAFDREIIFLDKIYFNYLLINLNGQKLLKLLKPDPTRVRASDPCQYHLNVCNLSLMVVLILKGLQPFRIYSSCL